MSSGATRARAEHKGVAGTSAAGARAWAKRGAAQSRLLVPASPSVAEAKCSLLLCAVCDSVGSPDCEGQGSRVSGC
jgi:hypothetical protein